RSPRLSSSPFPNPPNLAVSLPSRQTLSIACPPAPASNPP
ncbi:hypothetical protein RRG08_051249, partial [Elysia crispata]